MRLFFIFMLVPLAPLAALALDLTDQQRADIEKRIQPFSAVCVQGQTCGGGSDAVAASADRSGEDVTMRRAWPAIQPASQVHPR